MKFGKILIIFSVLLISLTFLGCESKDRNNREEKTEERKSSAKKKKPKKKASKEETAGINKFLEGFLSNSAQMNNDEETKIREYLEKYREVLETHYQMLFLGDDERDMVDNSIGIMETVYGLSGIEALEKIGFALKDVNEDGIPELLIGYVSGNKEEGYYSREILALYTYKDNQVRYVLGGAPRDSYSLLNGKNRIYNCGSAGAMYSLFGLFALSNDGTELQCRDFYFTAEKDENFEEIGYYHNTKPDIDRLQAGELENGLEEFSKIQADLEDEIVSYHLTPFKQSPFIPSSNHSSVSKAKASVSVFYEDQVIDRYDDFDEYIADNDPSGERLAFVTDTGVKDFKVMSISFEGVDENDEVIYSGEELYDYGKLDPRRPLIVRMSSFETMPRYGISYRDDTGKIATYLLYESGRDGSLVLQEISINQ